MSYSQNDEEEVILKFFGEFQGSFLDIGAFDGLHLSNTRRLLELGWSGVMVEPSPSNFLSLLANCSKFPKATFVNAAMSGSSVPLVPFCIETTPERGWASTITQDLVNAPGYIIAAHPAKTYIKPITPSDIVDAFGVFDFISLDAEWEDEIIWAAMPESAIKHCQLLCIEPRDIPHRNRLKVLLSKQGFRVYHETPENLMVSK